MRNWRVEEFETPSDAMFLYGADWGFSVDPTCLVRLWVDEEARRIYIDQEAWKVALRDRRPPCPVRHRARVA